MSFFIIPHPTQLLTLTEIQKKVLFNINSVSANNVFFPNFPLWFEIPSKTLLDNNLLTENEYENFCNDKINFSVQEFNLKDKNQIKKVLNAIKLAIKEVTIVGIDINNNGIFFSAEIELNRKKCKIELYFGSINSINKDSVEKSAFNSANLNQFKIKFPMQCKIFELAFVQKSGIQLNAWETVWVKLK